MRARTVGDLRRELAGVDDETPLSVEMPWPSVDLVDDAILWDRLDPMPGLDVDRVEVTTGQVILHVDGEAIP